jgi:hypothetical protein
MIESPRVFPKLYLLMGVHEVHDETSEMSRETVRGAVKCVLPRLGFPEGMPPLRGDSGGRPPCKSEFGFRADPAKEGGIPAFAGETAVSAEEI